ncbi:MAG: HEAT repeat domain-containing protein [Gemmatimonadota bacterium]
MRPAHLALAAALVVAPLAARSGMAPERTGDGPGGESGPRGMDSTAVARLFTALRASDPMVCAMATGFVGRGFSWSDGAEGIAALRDEGAEGRLTRERLQSRVGEAAALRQLGPELRSPNACLRRTAAAMLGASQQPELLGMLRRALSDDDGRVREAAALGLGVAEDTTDAPRLRAALGDRDPDVVRLAIWALGSLEDHAAAADIVALLRSPNPGIRRAAAWALGRV